jgi:hypothetical protein
MGQSNARPNRQGCALILANRWPEKIGKGLTFISLNVEPATREAAVAAVEALRVELEANSSGRGWFLGLPASGGR